MQPFTLIGSTITFLAILASKSCLAYSKLPKQRFLFKYDNLYVHPYKLKIAFSMPHFGPPGQNFPGLRGLSVPQSAKHQLSTSSRSGSNIQYWHFWSTEEKITDTQEEHSVRSTLLTRWSGYTTSTISPAAPEIGQRSLRSPGQFGRIPGRWPSLAVPPDSDQREVTDATMCMGTPVQGHHPD
jgi:hypothetical protein